MPNPLQSYLQEKPGESILVMALSIAVALAVLIAVFSPAKVYPPLPDAVDANNSALADYKADIRAALWEAIEDDKTSLMLRARDFYVPRDPLGGLRGLIDSQVEGKGYEVECIEKKENNRGYSSCTVRWDFVVMEPAETLTLPQGSDQ